LQRFVLELASPLTTLVGDEWAAGRLAVFEEHLFAEILQGVLRTAIQVAGAPVHASAARPCILLTTVPLERHGLGLLMAEALLTIAGAQCVSLGVQTPLADIVAAARLHGADVVALSFSSAMSPRAVVDNVTELKERLAPRIQVWAGGTGAWQARRRLGPGCAMDLAAIPAAVTRWRGQQESAAA
jgi:methanogenic corrinoid protein MtbC1